MAPRTRVVITMLHVTQRGRTLIVLDAKYKIWRRQPKSQDVYQVMAGGRISACENVYLIYPSPNNGGKEPISWRIRGEGSPTHVTAVFVDLLKMGDYYGEEALANRLNEDLMEAI
jgi:5-methylcytosine-specific restriction endonuclease McrBC regulatory subunit McrC